MLLLALVTLGAQAGLTQLGSSFDQVVAQRAQSGRDPVAARSRLAVTSRGEAGSSDVWDGVIDPIGRGLRGFAGRFAQGLLEAGVGAWAVLGGAVALPSPTQWPPALGGWLSRKASSVFALISTSIRLRAPAQTLGGALADNLIDLAFDPLTSLGRQAQGNDAWIDAMVRIAGSASPAHHDLVVLAIRTLPTSLLARISRYNVRFFVGVRPGDADRTRENPIYESMSHNIALQFWHTERVQTIYHEVGHALDNQNRTFAIGFEDGSLRPGLGHYHYSSSEAFIAAYNLDFPTAGDGYYDTRDANGRAEAFAESFSLWYLEPEQLAWQWPNLYAYWQSNPLGLSVEDHQKSLADIESKLGMTLDDYDDAFDRATRR